MNCLRTIVNISGIILLLSTCICGLYLHFNRDEILDYNSSVHFHLVFAVLTVIFVSAALILSRYKSLA